MSPYQCCVATTPITLGTSRHPKGHSRPYAAARPGPSSRSPREAAPRLWRAARSACLAGPSCLAWRFRASSTVQHVSAVPRCCPTWSPPSTSRPPTGGPAARRHPAPGHAPRSDRSACDVLRASRLFCTAAAPWTFPPRRHEVCVPPCPHRRTPVFPSRGCAQEYDVVSKISLWF